MAKAERREVNVFLATLDDEDMRELERLAELWKMDIEAAFAKVVEAGLY